VVNGTKPVVPNPNKPMQMSCIKNLAKIPLAKLQQSLIPKRLQSAIKRKGDVTQW